MMKETIQTNNAGIPIVTRHYPGCINAFLRWQVGVYETRPIEDPCYEAIIDPATRRPATCPSGSPRYQLTYKSNPRVLCKVFHLLGFADNLKTAKSRALASL